MPDDFKTQHGQRPIPERMDPALDAIRQLAVDNGDDPDEVVDEMLESLPGDDSYEDGPTEGPDEPDDD